MNHMATATQPIKPVFSRKAAPYEYGGPASPYTFKAGNRIRRRSDGRIGRVKSSGTHYATVSWDDPGEQYETEEIEQLDPRYDRIR